MDLSPGRTERAMPRLNPAWRAMGPNDLDRTAEIALVGFPDHFEGRDCFENRLALFPDGCFVLDGPDGVLGYLVAYPWLEGSAPALNTRIETLPADADVLYLHDLALDLPARGGGWSGPAMAAVLDLARAHRFAKVALVAVNDAAPFWGRHGFQAAQAAGMAEKLKSYGPDARYMTRAV